MTIFNPQKRKNNIAFVALVLVVAVVGGALYISQYNAVAENRYEIKETKKEIAEAESHNVELKNNFYQIVDPAKLEAMADKHNLVMENTPDYMNPVRNNPDLTFNE